MQLLALNTLAKFLPTLIILLPRKCRLENASHLVPSRRMSHRLAISHPTLNSLEAAHLSRFKLVNVAKSRIDNLFQIGIIKVDVVAIFVKRKERIEPSPTGLDQA